MTFGNETNDEEIRVTHRLNGELGVIEHDVSIDLRLIEVPTLIKAVPLIPMRIQHIRVYEADDNSRLVGLICQLIGLKASIDKENNPIVA